MPPRPAHSFPTCSLQTPKGELQGSGPRSPHMAPMAHSPRTKMTCSARPVPTALVTVQMKAVHRVDDQLGALGYCGGREGA
ncbi:hypothetical protein P7K49_034555 [Saguinus oedipus]|uniref:Uncharacterized protein n=1 Tax=Saguinus oedipus TaxID=9490 RepID=A0ABQ9TV43_SAGOE|nr:hypothetical protein P7K49_034555 [Saguinus oedipus]